MARPMSRGWARGGGAAIGRWSPVQSSRFGARPIAGPVRSTSERAAHKVVDRYPVGLPMTVF
jgi:hypothetical protein